MNEEVTNYTLHGKNIVHMTKDKGNQHDSLHFFYDASNKPAIVEFNGTKYAYVHNLQGDIVAILDSTGTAVVQYKYDAWGRQISCTFAAGNDNAEALSILNPFRYRGYVYDEETGLYYLRSRYYSAVLTRFLNTDTYIKPAYNLYRYCSPNPIALSDPDGTDEFWTIMLDEAMVNRSFLSGFSLSYIAPMYQGNTSGVWDPNSTWARVATYNEKWINSDYNYGYQTPAHNQTQPNQSHDKMREVRNKGQAGESAVGYPKNTKHIPSLTDTAAYRVPDIWTDSFLGEVKNYTRPVRLTPQIIDEILFADQEGVPFILFTDAPLAPSLKQLYDHNVFILRNIYK